MPTKYQCLLFFKRTHLHVNQSNGWKTQQYQSILPSELSDIAELVARQQFATLFVS